MFKIQFDFDGTRFISRLPATSMPYMFYLFHFTQILQ